MRNIRIGKEIRDRGNAPWLKKTLNDNQKLNTTDLTVKSS